eukprot:jgi/Botrbrau1/4631/Bobra.33_2s0003.1
MHGFLNFELSSPVGVFGRTRCRTGLPSLASKPPFSGCHNTVRLHKCVNARLNFGTDQQLRLEFVSSTTDRGRTILCRARRVEANFATDSWDEAEVDGDYIKRLPNLEGNTANSNEPNSCLDGRDYGNGKNTATVVEISTSHESLDGVWTKEIGDTALREELKAEIKTESLRLDPEEREGMVKAAEVIEREVEAEERLETLLGMVTASILFGCGIWAVLGFEKAAEFYAGYVVEQSLSIDNLFVFILIFNYFQTPKVYESKVLWWGIWTAAILRCVFIGAGSTMIEHFSGVLLVFAGLLLFSSYKIMFVDEGEDDEDLGNNVVVQLSRKYIPVSQSYDGSNFWTVENGVRTATPLLLVLVVVELSDVMFAIDSVPAVFGVTKDPLIVWTSNMAAILSLRALYSFVSTVLQDLQYLDKAVGLILAWVSIKLFAEYFGAEINTYASLAIVLSLLAGGIGASLLFPEQEKKSS